MPQRGADWESSASPRRTVSPVPSSVVTRGVDKGQGRSSDSSRQDFSPGQGQTQRGASALCPPTETSPPLWNPSACHWVPSEWAGDPGVYRGQALGEELSFQFADRENQGILAWKTVHPQRSECARSSAWEARPQKGVTRGSPVGSWPAVHRHPDFGCALLSGPTARLYFQSFTHVATSGVLTNGKRVNMWCLFLAYKHICACTPLLPSASR